MINILNSSDLKFHNAHQVRFLRLFIFISLLPILNACSTLSNGRNWGQDATWNPGWSRIKNATIDAVLSPETWGPVAAALVLQVDDMDSRISDWASDKTPVFGSNSNARKWSNYFKDAAGDAYLMTILLTPSGDDPVEWSIDKMKGFAVGATALWATSGTTSLIKEETERTRPDDSDNLSFPSGHSSDASSLTTLTSRNISCISMPPAYRRLSNIALYGLSAGTAWARVEAKKHYPSDVLVGYALGHFISAVIYDSFMGLDKKEGLLFSVEPSRHGINFGITWTY